MSNLLNFPTKSDEFVEDEDSNLDVLISDLLEKYSMRDIILALMKNSSFEDSELILPSFAKIASEVDN